MVRERLVAGVVVVVVCRKSHVPHDLKRNAQEARTCVGRFAAPHNAFRDGNRVCAFLGRAMMDLFGMNDLISP